MKDKVLFSFFAVAWAILVVLHLRVHGNWIYWAILVAWCLIQLATLLQQTDLYRPWRRVERKRDALGSLILQIAQRHEDAGELLPYQESANYLNQKIGNQRNDLTRPGATGDTSALDDFTRTLQPLLELAHERNGFPPAAYCSAAMRIGKDWIPGDDMRNNLGPSMLGAAGESIPELAPLVARYNELYGIAKARRYEAAFEDGVRRRQRWFHI